MEVIMLEKDGRCKWLEKKVLKKLLPQALMSALNKNEKTMYIIEEWVSNDQGKVGVDTKWLHKLGVPVASSYKDVPADAIVVNTGYDSIVHEEKILVDKNIEILDEPCPYIRKIRRIFEVANPDYQYVLLCEPNHIIIKNFRELYPDDMILVQMGNYKDRLLTQENKKPLYLIPYVTFLPKHVRVIFDFIQEQFPDRENKLAETCCMWIASPSSPIIEIQNLSEERLSGIKDALLITSSGSANKSLISLIETLEDRDLNVVLISAFSQYKEYEKKHQDSKVLLVRSPIPNNAEKIIVNYIEKGYLYAQLKFLIDSVKKRVQKPMLRLLYVTGKLNNLN